MFALIAGTGALPGLVAEGLRAQGKDFVICEMEGVPADLPGDETRLTFRLETLGTFLSNLRARSVHALCMAGALQRPLIEPGLIDDATAPLIGRLRAAMERGDDGTLRDIVALFEEQRITVVGAQDLRPDLLAVAGCKTKAQPNDIAAQSALTGDRVIAEMGRADTGQACIIRGTEVLAREGPDGTDAMISAFYRAPMPARDPLLAAAEGLARFFATGQGTGAYLYKAPKPAQDRRVDLPTIGPRTVQACAAAGFSGIIVEAGGVLILGRDDVLRLCDDAGLVLWERVGGSRG